MGRRQRLLLAFARNAAQPPAGETKPWTVPLSVGSPVSGQDGSSPSASGGLVIAGSTAKSAFSRASEARPRWRTESIHPSAIVGQASR